MFGEDPNPFPPWLIYPSRWSDREKSGAICCGEVGVGNLFPLQVTLTSALTTTNFQVTMDPVAAKSSFLCLYMSSHKDTLASYVIYYGKVANTKITNAEMIRIDSKVAVHSRAFRPYCLIATFT